MLGMTTFRVGEKLQGFSPSTNPVLILLPEVMETLGGWHQGCKHHCMVVALQHHPAKAAVLLVLAVPLSHCFHCCRPGRSGHQFLPVSNDT
jgi:hypothetical protein